MGLDNGGWSKADDLAQSYEHNFTMKDRVKELESKLEALTTVIKRAIKDHDEKMITAGWHDLECERFKKVMREIE